MHLVYLIAIEDIVRSPLIRSQVIALLKALAARPRMRITLVALYPIANRLRFRREVGSLRCELADAGIALHVLPLLFLTRLFYIPRRWLPLYLIQAWIVAVWIRFALRPAVIHCRSYPAALIGHWVKRWSGCRLVFDARALYPEEGVSRIESGKTRLLDEADFALWKRLEARLLAAADAVAAVSQPMADILAGQYPDIADRLFVAPACTAVPTRADLAAWRPGARQELDLGDRPTAVYVGGWVDRGALSDLFRALRDALPSARWQFLLLISVSDPQGVAAYLQRELGPDVVCSALAVPPGEVIRLLAGADLAVLPVWRPVRSVADARYEQVARTILSVKFTEYLAAGLPVIVSRWAGAAADIVREHDLGIVYDEASPEELAAWLARWQMARGDFSARAWSYAREHFALEAVAARYEEIYRRK
ncbi:MAG: glycosyltransferase family 4 protein [Anaerolineae bacterium]